MGDTDTPNRVSSDKMECFEGIRGIASLSVLLGHLIIAFWPTLYNAPAIPHEYPRLIRFLARSPFRVFYDAQFAVSIFFLLSGFVLSLSYFKTRSLTVLSSAAVRRYFRLMLPAACSILLAYWLLKAGMIVNTQASEFMSQSRGFPHQWIGYFYHFRPHFTDALRECVWSTFYTNSLYNQNLWTMSIELAGSFFVYQFLALFGHLRNRFLLYTVFAGICVFTNRLFILDFLLGMVLCDVYMSNQQGYRVSVSALWAACLCLVGVLVVYYKPIGNFKFAGLQLEKHICYETLAGVLVLASAAFSPGFQRVFHHRFIVFLGKISFALYLVHLLLICSLASGAYLLLARTWGLPHHPAALIAATLCIAVSFAAAWVMYLYVDRPAIWVGKRVYALCFQPRSDRAFTTAGSGPAAKDEAAPVLLPIIAEGFPPAARQGA